jgi:2-iminobutanoate/2-iminopropanoate deaminase
MPPQTLSTPRAPLAIGPYSQAIVIDGWVYCSGQIPLGVDGTLVAGGIDAQTEQVLHNLKEVLSAAGADLNAVVKTTVYVQDLRDFARVNAIYEHSFDSHKPARSTVQVARLPKDALVEIDAIARLP